jgi:hypothetical protein
MPTAWRRHEQARAVLQNLVERAKRQYVPPLAFAHTYIGLGDKDRAFEWLERAYQERASWLIFTKEHPRYDRLRSDPRFTALMKKVGIAR